MNLMYRVPFDRSAKEFANLEYCVMDESDVSHDISASYSVVQSSVGVERTTTTISCKTL